jgi:two-component system cell cycle sensor histidine kinase/response regulator CckA
VSNQTDVERDRDLSELRASHRQLRTIMDSMPDLLTLFDAGGRINFVSASIVRTFGVDPQMILGRTPVELGLCDDPASDRELVASIQRVLVTGKAEQLEVNFAHPDGPRSFEVRHLPEWGDGQVMGVVGIARDLTPQRAAARQLYLLNYALDNISDAVYLMSGESPAFRYVNQAAARALGYSREKLTGGMGVIDIDPAVDEVRWNELLKTLRDTPNLCVESLHRTRDGRIIPVEITGNYFEFDGKFHNLAIARDISERRAAEAAHRALEDKFRQAQKMEAVGQLAGGIAHDFNNVLAIIQLASSALLEAADMSDEVRNGLNEMRTAADRAANLTRQLLMFSRRQVVELVDVDIGEVVRSTTHLLARVIGEHVSLNTLIDSSLPLVRADPGMLEQVVMNLAINARDAMPQGGKIDVKLETANVANPRTEGETGRVEAPHVCLSVSDTGSGIAAADLPHIFEPFFTTKALGHGSGLGLATVFNILELHGGFIDVDSAVGRGTTFRMFFPALEANLPRPSRTVTAGRDCRGTETVLLVEDDPAVRTTTRVALTRYGYRVIEADSAATALEIWRTRSGDFALLLTDLVMPGELSGRQLAEKLVAEASHLKVIFTSGYSPEIVNRLLRRVPGHTLLQKPYSAAVLACAVRRALDETVEPERL